MRRCEKEGMTTRKVKEKRKHNETMWRRQNDKKGEKNRANNVRRCEEGNDEEMKINTGKTKRRCEGERIMKRKEREKDER